MRFEITQKITDQIVNKSPENICLVFSYRPSIGSPIANIKVNYPMYLPFYCWRWGAKGLLGPLPSFVSFARHPTAGDNLLYIMTNTNVNCKKSKLTVTYQTPQQIVWKQRREYAKWINGKWMNINNGVKRWEVTTFVRPCWTKAETMKISNKRKSFVDPWGWMVPINNELIVSINSK